MKLKDLGTYRVERTEDYDLCSFDKSYCEIIRVKGSKTEDPIFKVVSHLYKFSESELALYLKDHKNLWRSLGKLFNFGIDISEEEAFFKFPVSMFSDVAKIIPFVKKRGKVELTVDERQERINRLRNAHKRTRKIEQIIPNLEETASERLITLETFESDAF